MFRTNTITPDPCALIHPCFVSTLGIPHILVVPLIPLTLVAGPVGLCFYLVLKSLYTFFRRPVNAGAHTNEERADDAAGREAPVSVHRQHLRKSVCKNRLRLWVYLGLCSLCVFMVVWIFHMPGTFRLGFESTRVQHAQTLDDMYRGDVKVPLWGKLNLEKLFGQLNVFTTPGSTNGAENGLDAGGTAQTLRYALPVTPDVLFKYDRQTLVVALHHIPAGVWSMLIPLQLYTPLRRKFPRVHRVMGYVFALSSLLVTAGVCVIMHRRLDFISYNAEASTAIGQTDDADSGGSSTGDDTSRGTGAGSGASDFDRSFPSEWGFGDKYLLYSIMWVITAYFFVSVLQLVR